MVSQVRRGVSLRAVAKACDVSLRTVQVWVARAGSERLDRVDWNDRPRGGRRAAQATSSSVEDLILEVRRRLKTSSALGEFGAVAIRRELTDHPRKYPLKKVPALRTIGRILTRRGALDGGRRVRRPPPPKGWYLPRVAGRKVELDSGDLVEGLVIRGGQQVEVFNLISLHGGLTNSFVKACWTTDSVLKSLEQHWREHGLPGYMQFDNDTVFQGPHQHADVFGRVTRMCLQLGVTPVFAPPRENGFQASIEAYNGRWQQKVWQRFSFTSLRDVRQQSDRFVKAVHQRSAIRIQDAPRRRAFPNEWTFDARRKLKGTVIYIRRTNDHGEVSLLGHTFPLDVTWLHRLIRCEVDLTQGKITSFKLRRREPHEHPKIKTIDYKPQTKHQTK
jgi:hypothetical protein